MRANVALALSIVAGALAIGLVAADTVWSLQLSIESQNAQGQWEVATTSKDLYRSDPFFGPGECASTALRLVVDNHKPIPETVHVRFWYMNATGGTHFFADERISLAAFEVRMFEGTVPPEAFEQRQDPNQTLKPVPQVHVNGQAGDDYLGVCVEQEAA